MLVRVLQRLRGLVHDLQRLVDRERAVALEARAQRLALDERHGEPEPPRGGAGVVDGEDVRVLQPRGEPDLPLEAGGAERLGDLGVEHLERDRAVVLAVAGEIDRGHSPAAELALERVAIAQRRGELSFLGRDAHRYHP
ncbi:MAG: hypothetical protein IRY91_06100 [Gemmatimonadaceae bacterium]|nr:hypothetical protein [Gemmatimonadaceae bacterium]